MKALPWIQTAFQAGSSIVGGQQNAGALRMQARVASQQSLADEAAQRRDNRAFRGSAAAALAENGLSSTGSSAAMIEQSAAMAELDALNIRYQGQLRRMGLLAEAKDASRGGLLLAGQRLLKGVGDNYRPGKRVPKSEPATDLTAIELAGLNG